MLADARAAAPTISAVHRVAAHVPQWMMNMSIASTPTLEAPAKNGHAPITEAQIKGLVAAWYLALDQHDPIENCYALLVDDGLVMAFPDGDIRDHASFKKWYDRVINLFFDENHVVNSVSAVIAESGDEAAVDVIVGWQASWWEAPAAKSKRVSMDATQRWVVRRSNKNKHGLVIAFYNAQHAPFNYAPGFARL
jgi:hypothetical protein